MVLRFILFLFCLALAPGRASEPMTLAKLLPLVLDRADAQEHFLTHWQYDQSTHTEQLDNQDKATHQEDMILRVRPGAAQEYTVVSLKGDDLPADPDQAQAQAAGKGKEMQHTEQTFSLRSLVDRFTLTLEGMDGSFGSPCYYVRFEPKPDQPFSTMTEKVLNHLHGHLWIDPLTYTLRQTRASLAQPVEIAWIFAQIDSLNFHYQAQKLSALPEEVPGQVSVEVEVKAPFYALHQIQQSTMSHYVRRADPL